MGMHDMLGWFPAHGGVVTNLENLVRGSNQTPTPPPSTPGSATATPSYMSAYLKAQYQFTAGRWEGGDSWKSAPTAWFCVSLGWSGGKAKSKLPITAFRKLLC